MKRYSKDCDISATLYIEIPVNIRKCSGMILRESYYSELNLFFVCHIYRHRNETDFLRALSDSR